MQSSCELPSSSSPTQPATSRVMRYQPSTDTTPHTWQGVPMKEYKPAADHHCGVIRSVLVGERGERTAYQLRYFEIAPGGFTTLEHHEHEHTVVVLRGQGEIRLGETLHPIEFGDTVYVAPHEVHQLKNRSNEEPFGFLCLVDTQRDRPVVVENPGEQGNHG